MKTPPILRTLTRSFETLEVQPVQTATVVGSSDGSASYGSDSKDSMGLAGLTTNESAEWQPPLRFFTIDQMRREDAAVKSAFWLLTQPIRSALWSHVPVSRDPADRLIADACDWQFGLGGNDIGKLDLSWREQLSQSLLYLAYGSMFEEIMLGDVDIFYDADGDPHIMRPFSRLAPRFPQTIKVPDGFVTDPRTGLIASLEQWLPDARPIPGNKLVWYVLDREGVDWYGTSLLRPMYGAWKLKRAVMISAGIGWDRFAFGTPVVRYPQGAGGQKRKAEEMARNWRTHERGWFVLEGTQQQGWDIEIVGGQGNFSDPTPLIHTYDEQIASAALQHFIVLGRTGTGARAVGDALAEPYYMFLQSIADDIAEAKQRHLLRKFVDLNFGAEFDVPKLNVSKLQSRNVAVLAASIAALADAGFSFTDPETQNDVRDILDLRQLPIETQQAIGSLPDGVGVEPPVTPAPPAMPGPRQPAAGTVALREREGRGLGY